MEMKNNAGKSLKPIRVRYAGKATITQYGVHLENAEISLGTAIARALGVKEGGNPVEFLGEIVVMLRPLEGAGLTVEEVTGE